MRRFALLLLTLTSVAFAAAPVRYRCDELLVRMEQASQRRANIVFLNALAETLLRDGSVPGDLLPRLVEQPAFRAFAPHLKRFEDAILAPYLPDNPALQHDAAARRAYFAQAFDLPEPAVEALLHAYDFELAELPDRATLAAIFPIALPRTAIPRSPDERLEELRNRSHHYQQVHGTPEPPKPPSPWGDSLWLRDLRNQLELIRSLDGSSAGAIGNAGLARWIGFHAGRLASLWGSFVERRQIGFGPAAATTYPGTDIRVGGRRHADGWRYRIEERSTGTTVFVLEGLGEAKASAMAAYPWFGQFRDQIRRLFDAKAAVHISGQVVEPANLLVRTRTGLVTLAALRAEHDEEFLNAATSDERFLASYLAVFDEEFFHLYVPRGETPPTRLDGIRVVEGTRTRGEELRAYSRFLARHLVDTDEAILFETLAQLGRQQLPPVLRRAFLGLSGLPHEADEAARAQARLAWMQRLLEAQLQLGRPLRRSDFGPGAHFSENDWGRLVGTGHFAPGNRDGKDGLYDGVQPMLLDYSRYAGVRGLKVSVLDFTPRDEAYDPEFAALLQDEVMERLAPFLRAEGRLPDLAEASALPEPLYWYRVTAQKDYHPNGTGRARSPDRRIFDGPEGVVFRAKELAAQEGFRFRVYRSYFIAENVSPALRAIMREELIDDVLDFVATNKQFPRGNDDYGPLPLQLDDLTAYGREQSIFPSLEEMAMTAHRVALARRTVAHLLTAKFANGITAEMRAAFREEAYLLLEPALEQRGDQVLTTEGLKAANLCNMSRLLGTGLYRGRGPDHEAGSHHGNRVFDSLEQLRNYAADRYFDRHGVALAHTRRSRR